MTEPMATVLLGAIALATLVMAAVQVGAIIYGVRLARRVERLTAQLEQDVRPLIERLVAMSADASRATTLATHQMEKLDRLVTDASARLDRGMHALQHALVLPAREGLALAAAVRATVATLRDIRRRRREVRFSGDEEDALFIG